VSPDPACDGPSSGASSSVSVAPTGPARESSADSACEVAPPEFRSALSAPEVGKTSDIINNVVEAPTVVPVTAISQAVTVHVRGELSYVNNVYSCVMLVDTGSAVSLISTAAAKSLNVLCSLFPVEEIGINDLASASGGLLNIVGAVKIEFTFGNLSFPHNVMVVDGLQESCIVGADFCLRTSLYWI